MCMLAVSQHPTWLSPPTPRSNCDLPLADLPGTLLKALGGGRKLQPRSPVLQRLLTECMHLKAKDGRADDVAAAEAAAMLAAGRPNKRRKSSAACQVSLSAVLQVLESRLLTAAAVCRALACLTPFPHAICRPGAPVVPA